jgi:translation initiation factor 2B subunit (eIF-2B alpha/beta/delta family)
MASIWTLANRALLARGNVRQVIEEALEPGRMEAAAEFAADVIRDGAVVLTHSHSSVVAGALVAAKRRGGRFDVIATESRPMREGVTLARALAERGIHVRVIADAAVGRFAAEATLAMVGADAITPRGVVNKIGTSLLGLAARECSIPLYAVATADKLMPFVMEDRLMPPEELVPERTAGISVTNRYFDTTPFERFTSIITENGACAPEDLEARLARIEVHPDLV